MASNIQCPHCGRPNFKTLSALQRHIRNSICAHTRDSQGNLGTPVRETFLPAQAQNDSEDGEDDGDAAPMEDDDVPTAPVPIRPDKKAYRRQAIQAVQAHDVDQITLQLGELWQSKRPKQHQNSPTEAKEETEDEEYAMLKAAGHAQDEESSYEKEEDGSHGKGLDPHEPDTWIRDQFRAYCIKAKESNKPFTEEEITAIKLMDLLHQKNAAINTYDAVMLWHLQENGMLYNFQTLKDYPQFIGRKIMLERLAKRYNFQNKMPYRKKIVLPVSGTAVSLTLHNTKATIQRLLTDPRIEAEDYLFWEEGKPLAPPPEKLEVIRDLNTGRAYLDTYAKMIDPNGREALMPVVIYFDGTAVSHFHNMEVIQVNIALGTYTREARNKDFLWAPLGCIEKISEQGGRGREILKEAQHMATQYLDESDADDLDSDDSQKEKVTHMSGIGDKNDQDTHAMFACVLEEFVALQDTGFLWDHHDPGTGELTPDIHYKLFVPFFKVDGKEADFACAKYNQRSKAQQICRKCHCPLKYADDYMANYKPKTVDEIRKLIDKADLDGLKALSQTYLQNAFYKLRFSQGNKAGVHGACPSELLHAFLLGTFKYVRDSFFELIGKESETARQINALAQVYGKFYVRQSDRTMPTTFFTRGIQVGKLMAKDYRGVLLIILTIVKSTKGRNILKSARKKNFREDSVLNKWILLVELMLEWESYLNEPQMMAKHVKRLEKKHRYIMYIIRKFAPRKEGMRWKLSKFHTILHIWEDILQFGVPLEYDTSPNESFHKPTKAASKMTQKDVQSFNYQTAKRLVEFFLVGLAIVEIATGKKVWEYYDRQPPPKPPDIKAPEPWTGDTRIIVYRNEKTQEADYDIITESKFKGQTTWPQQIIDFLAQLQDKIEDYMPGPLPIYTCHRRNEQIFRGHPNYRGKGPWQDWAWIDWGRGYGRLPGQIWCFVILSGIPQDRHTPEHGGIRLSDGVFAVVESSIIEEIPKEEYTGNLFTAIKKDVGEIRDGTVRKRQFYLADTEAIVDPACVVPDLGGDTNRYFVVLPRNQWANKFQEWVEADHKLDKMDPLPTSDDEDSDEEELEEEKGSEDESEDEECSGEEEETEEEEESDQEMEEDDEESEAEDATVVSPVRKKQK